MDREWKFGVSVIIALSQGGLFSAEAENETFNVLDQGRAAEMKHRKHTVSS